MEVDERLRWLEARISSSLHPRGDELRNLFADDQSRYVFLSSSSYRKLPIKGGVSCKKVGKAKINVCHMKYDIIVHDDT